MNRLILNQPTKMITENKCVVLLPQEIQIRKSIDAEIEGNICQF